MEQALEHGAAVAAQRGGRERGELGGVRVHLDHRAVAARHLRREVGGGVDRGGGADDQHAVAAGHLLGAAPQHVRRNRLAEVDRIPFDDTAALGTARRKLLGVDGDLRRREARHAVGTAQEVVIAVNLQQRLRAGLTVQAVDVLRDERGAVAPALELRQRPVACVGLGRRQGLAQGLRPGRRGVQALAPGAGRVAQEALVAVHGRLAVLRPQSAGTAEGGDAALHREPRAGERHHVPGLRHGSGRGRDLAIERLGQHELLGDGVRHGSVQRSVVAVAALAAPGLEVFHLHRPQLLAHAVAPPAVLDGAQAEGAARRAVAPEVEPGDQHAAQVTDVADVVAAAHHREDEEDRDQPDRPEGDGREDQHDRAVGPRERVGQHDAVDRTRRAERRNDERVLRRDAEDHREVGPQRDDEARADAADQVEAQEALRAPGHRHLRAEHPEHEAIHADVEQRAVQPHVGKGLPEVAALPDQRGRHGEEDGEVTAREQLLRDVHDGVDDQQLLDHRRGDRRPEAHARLAGPTSVHDLVSPPLRCPERALASEQLTILVRRRSSAQAVRRT